MLNDLRNKSTENDTVPHRSAYDAYANRICRQIIAEATLAGELLTVAEPCARFEQRSQAVRCAA